MEWPKCFKRFERFHQASGFSKSFVNNINILVYKMGNIAKNNLSLSGLSEESKVKYDVMVVEKFNTHFVKKCNFQRSQFNQQRQEVGESVNDFVTFLLLVRTL